MLFLFDFYQQVIDGIDNLDLLHAASALYSLSLPDVEHDTIYKCIHAKDAHSILVLLSMQDAKDHCLASMKNKVRRKKKEESEKGKNYLKYLFIILLTTRARQS